MIRRRNAEKRLTELERERNKWMEAEAVQSNKVMELKAEVVRLVKTIELKNGYIDRIGFCPDCRDKLDGNCTRCEVQRLTAEVEKYKDLFAAENADAFGYLAEIQRLTGALEALEVDNHYWSKRPCPTCRIISETMGRPYGCSMKAEQALERRDKP